MFQEKMLKNIKENVNTIELIEYVKSELFYRGPTDEVLLEIIAYLKLFRIKEFEKSENQILEFMGLFFKGIEASSMRGKVFAMYQEYIKIKYQESYTPMQANIIRKIKDKKNFSFSAPTSTGKSFVFRYLISNSERDIVVIVPSRALINEYYLRLKEIVDIKKTNILTFVERINARYTVRSIFILTPERARELFKNKEWLNIEMFLFDEAQLSEENSTRGLYFDSIVQRTIKNFGDSKIIFAHPFIQNPQAQIIKNKLDVLCSDSQNYNHRNVGQIFYAHDTQSGDFFHFGSKKEVFGNKMLSDRDPIEDVIKKGGSILVYTSKSSIYGKKIFHKFQKYIELCPLVENEAAQKLISDLKKFIGASDEEQYYHSIMLENLNKGIVIHHGSIPLNGRVILEKFTQKGYCRICFATSTLEQGINMPFDVVYIDRLEASKTLSVKNLIGRAGRTTDKAKFDYGSVIVNVKKMTKLRDILNTSEELSEVSQLDLPNDDLDEKYKEYKDAIKNDEFSDEFNLIESDLEKLQSENVFEIIPGILSKLFEGGEFVKGKFYDTREQFLILYQEYLGREMVRVEKSILIHSFYIMQQRFLGKTFSTICKMRYNLASKVSERRRDGKRSIRAGFLQGYQDIPNQNGKYYSLFPSETLAKDIDYDEIVFDTYDYLDKMIGFKLSDIYYAIFHRYGMKYGDERAKKLARYFKYNTENEKEIWMLKYGFDHEDFIWLDNCITSIDENEIVFNSSVVNLSDEQLEKIEQFNYNVTNE